MTATTPRPILDADELAAIKRLAKAASTGRWFSEFSVWRGRQITDGYFILASSLKADDAAHIARMDPPTTLALLDMLAQRDARIAELEEALRIIALERYVVGTIVSDKEVAKAALDGRPFPSKAKSDATLREALDALRPVFDAALADAPQDDDGAGGGNG